MRELENISQPLIAAYIEEPLRWYSCQDLTTLKTNAAYSDTTPVTSLYQVLRADCWLYPCNNDEGLQQIQRE